MKRALVPGTFDPVTEGHLDIIRRAAKLFDEVVVAVAASAGKGPSGPLFSLDERVSLVEQSVGGLSNVSAVPFEGLLVDLARSTQATAVVKGLRAITDFEYEFQMAAVNFELSPEVETVFIMSPPQYMYLSSSIVRELAQLGGDFGRFVPDCVAQALAEKFAE